MTASAALPLAVRAMRQGAADFLQKPVRAEALRESINRVLTTVEQNTGDRSSRHDVLARLAALTPRERQVMERVLAGQATKTIAAELAISERTVEHHRHGAMRKLGERSLARLIRLLSPVLGSQ